MSQYAYAKCPICQEQIKSPHSQKHAGELLAKHVLEKHVVKKHGVPTVRMPAKPETAQEREARIRQQLANGNRDQRRALRKRKRLKNQFRTAS